MTYHQPGPHAPMPPRPPRRSTGVKIAIGAGIAFAALVVLGILGAIVGDDAAAPKDETTAAAPKDNKPAAEPEEKPEEKDSGKDKEPAAEKPKEEAKEEPIAETGQLPNLVGRSLQDAQDTAQAAGFFGLTSHDATGMERFQVLDRNWVVCSQEPAAGEHGLDTTVDFGAVKSTETCP